MPVVTQEIGTFTPEIAAQYRDDVLRDIVRPILEARAKTLEAVMESAWPNPSTSRTQKGGKPSQSTGASSKAIAVKPVVSGDQIGLQYVEEDGVRTDRKTGRQTSVHSYSEYVHYAGQAVGAALERARKQFQRERDEIIEDIRSQVAAYQDRPR